MMKLTLEAVSPQNLYTKQNCYGVEDLDKSCISIAVKLLNNPRDFDEIEIKGVWIKRCCIKKIFEEKTSHTTLILNDIPLESLIDEKDPIINSDLIYISRELDCEKQYKAAHFTEKKRAEAIVELLKEQKQIKRLELINCGWLHWPIVEKIILSFPNLEYLSVKGSKYIHQLGHAHVESKKGIIHKQNPDIFYYFLSHYIKDLQSSLKKLGIHSNLKTFINPDGITLNLK